MILRLMRFGIDAFSCRKRFSKDDSSTSILQSSRTRESFGEHIDYMSFSVLTMTVTNDVVIAVGLDPESLSNFSVVTIPSASAYPAPVPW